MAIEHMTSPKGPEAGRSEKKTKPLDGLESLRKAPETSAEKPSVDREKNVEKARKTIETERQKPVAAAEKPSEKRETESSKAIVSKHQRQLAYRREMQEIRRQLPPVQRTFSRIVHNPVVETASEALEGTVMRPSFLVTGGIAALVLGAIVYFVARAQGFVLPGSQFLVVLVVGGLLGVLGELLLRRRKQ